METFVDLHPGNSFAVAVTWQSVELAWATISAVAILELSRPDAPFYVCHKNLPRLPQRGVAAAAVSEPIFCLQL
jgi:hypothetical protein